jgi:hypothetical protein
VAIEVGHPNNRKQAVSQGAPLIPTISHTLSGALYSNVRSAALKNKLELIYRRHADRQDLTKPVDEFQDDSQLRVRATCVSVWRLLTRETFNPKAGREIMPMVKDSYQNSRASADKMLFGIQSPASGSLASPADDLLAPRSDGYSEPNDYLFRNRGDLADSSDDSDWDSDGESERGSLLFEEIDTN